MFSNDRNELRQVFFSAWRKHQQRLPMEPLEAQLIEIILLHPEYQPILDDPENFKAENFAEENPFLHLSLHLAIREQVSTNRPAGIKKFYATLCEKTKNVLLAEHQMMDCLADILWQAQQKGTMPEEEMYLEALKTLL
jgi:hypothetical protein